MTREEAIKICKNIDASAEIRFKHPEVEEAFNMAIKALEQEPCEDTQERYEDLCEYFGDAKDILKSRKDFKAWLERIKWHIRKAEELYEKYEHKQEPCEDVISRQYLIEKATNWEKHFHDSERYVSLTDIQNAPPVKPQEPKTGHWKYIQYDKPQIGNWHCSECGRIAFLLKSQKSSETPLYDYCPWCGAKMESEEI